MSRGLGVVAVLAALVLPATAGAEKNKVTVGGRVFARAGVEDRAATDPTLELGVSTARVEATYEREDWLRLVVEAELTGRPDLRDGYLRIDDGTWALRAGQFKSPMSALELESRWRLPAAERGLINNIVLDRFQIGGRRPGFQGEWKHEGAVEMRVRAGVFQASGADGEILAQAEPGTVRVGGRLEVRAGDFEAGAFGESRAAQPSVGAEFSRFWSAGLDVFFERCGFRLWADAWAGSHWLDYDVFDGRFATFVSGRLIVAGRFGGVDKGDWYLEPYARGGALDPDLDITADLVWEATAGVNLGYWRIVRLQLQGTLEDVSRNTPALLGPAGTTLVDRKVVVLQIGSSF